MSGLEARASRAPQPGPGTDGQPIHDPAVSMHIREGHVHRTRGELELAIDCYLRAIELRPDEMDAHNSLCAVLLQMSQFEAVAAHSRQILAVRPDNAAACINLAFAQISTGDAAGALQTLLGAFRLADQDGIKGLFVLCLKSLAALPPAPEAHVLLLRAMSEPWGRPSGLVRHCVALVKANPGIAPCIDAAAAAWPERISVDHSLPAARADEVLRCLLENARVTDAAIERYLTNVRRALLDSVVSGASRNIDASLLDFYAALACQCFINEYIFALSDAERAAVSVLRDTLTADLQSGAEIVPLRLAALASYLPLHTIDGHEGLLARPWPPALDAVLTQQIREPATERRLRAGIPALTPIEDDVSLLVRQQYEENPYPRWVKSASLRAPTSVNRRLRHQFPLSRFRDLEPRDGIVDILVAGCGTGQQLIDLQRTTDARVLAIDLSMASLSYARRKTDEAGIRNIEYAQADILRLGTLDRRFDVVECGGVLHHLGDPLAGWGVLRSLLRPRGAMRIALYSEFARHHIVAAHRHIAEHGYGRSADDIRRFRQDILALPADHPLSVLAKMPDFFSTSDCRDLLFHVQEHRFTLPQIEDFLGTAGLEFLGFDADQRTLSRYGAQFPHDRARTDLANWHIFEQANPMTFRAMYQFWVQARD